MNTILRDFSHGVRIGIRIAIPLLAILFLLGMLG